MTEDFEVYVCINGHIFTKKSWEPEKTGCEICYTVTFKRVLT